MSPTFTSSRSRATCRTWLVSLVLATLIFPAFVQAVDRFPRPEFETGYESPPTDFAHQNFTWEGILDVSLLLIFIAVAAWLGLRKRSRRGLFLLTLAALVYFGFIRAGCVCPIGAIQNITLSAVDPLYAVPLVVLIFFLAPLLLTLVTGRSFCAGVCPLGAIQEVVMVKPIQLPARLDKALGILPYIYLGLAVMLVVSGGGFIICQYDPFVGFFRMGATAGMLSFGIGLLALGTVVGRPYCRFLCPYGVLMGWLSQLSWKHVKITPTTCIGCKLCENSCPFGAIRKPKAPASDPAEVAGRRKEIVQLFVLWPCMTAVGAFLGHSLAPVLEWTRVLVTDYNAPAVDLSTGGAVFGGFIGFMIILLALREPLRRPTPDYTIDPVLCVSCGRCFGDCPKESEQRLAQFASLTLPSAPILPPSSDSQEITSAEHPSPSREPASNSHA